MGKLTRADLMVLWKSAVDAGYSQPLQHNPNSGIELIEEGAEQLAVVSDAVETNSQAMFIMPHSSQTAPPGSGARFATVQIVLTRSGSALGEVTLARGTELEEVATDYGPDGGIEVPTGRIYVLEEPLTIAPGVAGLSFEAIAERPGYGYNFPLPETITLIVQLGASLSNVGAQIVPGIPSHNLICSSFADVLTPNQIGQYVILGGANLGQVRRMIGYQPAPADQSNGGTAVLAATGVIGITMVSGAFEAGENIEQQTTLAAGTLDVATAGFIVYERTTANDIAAGSNQLVGVRSGAIALVTAVYQAPGLLADTSVDWRIARWDSDLGLAISNPGSPSGGKSPMLDARGFDRGVQRTSGEADDAYRLRVHSLPDVVSPNAVKRAANRVLAPFGVAACVREVGEIDALFPGMFADVAVQEARFTYAYDLDLVSFGALLPPAMFEGERATQTKGDGSKATGIVTASYDPATGLPVFTGLAGVRGEFEAGTPITGDVSGARFTPAGVAGGLDPTNRFKLDLDYLEFRAFFLVGVPPPALGDFGIAFDVTSQINFFDAAPYLAFFDGFPTTSAVLNRRVWDAVNAARMGGVGFDLYVEDVGCF
jgi:hypothetical protein